MSLLKKQIIFKENDFFKIKIKDFINITVYKLTNVFYFLNKNKAKKNNLFIKSSY